MQRRSCFHPSDTPAGRCDLTRLSLKSRHHPKHHSKDHGDHGTFSPEYKHEFIACHGSVIGCEPQDHRHEHGSQCHAVIQGFQRIRPLSQMEQGPVTSGVEERIDCTDHHEDRDHAADHPKPLPPSDLQIIHGRKHQGTDQKRRMHDQHRKKYGADVKYEIDLRAVPRKCILSVHGFILSDFFRTVYRLLFLRQHHQFTEA